MAMQVPVVEVFHGVHNGRNLRKMQSEERERMIEIGFFKLAIIAAEFFFAVHFAAKAVDIKTDSEDKNEILAVLFARGFYMILGIGLFCAVLKNIIEIFG